MDVSTVIISACGSAFTAGIFGIVMWKLNRRAKQQDKSEELAQQVRTLSHQVEELTGQVKNLAKQVEDNSHGVRVTLHDRIRYLGQIYIRSHEIALDDRVNLVQMHDVYHDLGGNGNLDALMREVKKLPLKEDPVFDTEEKEWH